MDKINASNYGFTGLVCPRCGDETGISVNLTCLGEFRCPDCEAEFTAEDIQAMIKSWLPVLEWIGKAPKLES